MIAAPRRHRWLDALCLAIAALAFAAVPGRWLVHVGMEALS